MQNRLTYRSITPTILFTHTYLKTTTSTELAEQANFAEIEAETDERVEILVVHLAHLLRQQQKTQQ